MKVNCIDLTFAKLFHVNNMRLLTRRQEIETDRGDIPQVN